MKVGDLVKRTPELGAWVKHNPWMLFGKDFEIGIIVECDYLNRQRLVNWTNGPKWENNKDLIKLMQTKKLEVINDN